MESDAQAEQMDGLPAPFAARRGDDAKLRAADLRRLWSISAAFAEGRAPARLGRRLAYVLKALSAGPALARLLHAPDGSLLQRTVAGRPETLNLVSAPYVNARWDAATRLTALADHVELLERLPAFLGFDVHQSLELMPLPELGPDYHLVLDKPYWFHREGVLTLNLFRANLRLFSLSFAVEDRADGRTLLIGGVQGRNLPNALDEYRTITANAHGLRPRDLLLDLLRILTAPLEVTRMRGISDACRHHRSRYFGQDTGRALPLDYDEMWEDRGGQRSGDFYLIPVARQVRDPADIAAKKRAMYRRRYAMLDELEQRLVASLATTQPVTRPEAE